MRSISIRQYISLGTGYRYLQDASQGNATHTDGKGGVCQVIQRTLDGFENHSMPVSFRAAEKLSKFNDELLTKGKSHKLTSAEVKKLKRIVSALRPTMMAESGGIFALIVSDKRYLIDHLVDDVGSLMASGVYDLLPDIARLDFSEAGKCIAYERPTAAAFHVLRGTESVLKCLYMSYIKRGRINVLTWGGMTNHLSSKTRKPEKHLLDQLDVIRRNFRNPTQHPEKSYNLDEAQNLFALCVDAVERMARDDKFTK